MSPSMLLMGHGSPDRASLTELKELRDLVGTRIQSPLGLSVLEFPTADVPILEDVPDVDAYPQEDLPFGLGRDVPLLKSLLNLHGAFRRLDGARELDQESIAHGLDLCPVPLLDGGTDDSPLLIEKLDG